MWLDEEDGIVKPRSMHVRKRMSDFLEERKIDAEIQDHGWLIAIALPDHHSSNT